MTSATSGDDGRMGVLQPGLRRIELALIGTWMEWAGPTFHTWTHPLNRNHGWTESRSTTMANVGGMNFGADSGYGPVVPEVV